MSGLAGMLVVVVVTVHAAFIVALIAGPIAIYRQPRRWRFHVPVVAAMTAVTLAGADCPLTVWEDELRQRAGWTTHDTGFVSHYLVEPWHPDGITTPIRIAIVTLWLVPNVIAYARVARVASARASRRADPQEPPSGGMLDPLRRP